MAYFNNNAKFNFTNLIKKSVKLPLALKFILLLSYSHSIVAGGFELIS